MSNQQQGSGGAGVPTLSVPQPAGSAAVTTGSAAGAGAMPSTRSGSASWSRAGLRTFW